MDAIEKFAETRRRENLSYGAVARKIGVDRGTLSQIEKSQRKCSKDATDKIEKFLDKFCHTFDQQSSRR